MENKKDKQSKIDFFNQYFNWLVFGVVLIFVVFLYILLLRPIIAQKKIYNENELLQKEMFLKKQEKVYFELGDLQEIFAQKIDKDMQDKILNILPFESDLPNLYYSIDKIINKNNYKVSKINVDVPDEKVETQAETTNKKRKQIKNVLIEMEIEGKGYINFKNLLSDLEKNLRMLDVVQFSYSPSKEESVLKLRAYYYN